MIKQLALKAPQWVVNGNDVPSLFDATQTKQLVKFVSVNLYDGGDWQTDLNNSPNYEMQWTSFINRSFVINTANFNINYFVTLEESNYYFWKVVSRQKLNPTQVEFHLEMDVWMSYWSRLQPLPNREVLVHRAHSNRLYVNSGTYYPAFAHLTDPIINPEQDKPQLFPSNIQRWNKYELPEGDNNANLRFQYFNNQKYTPTPTVIPDITKISPTFTYAVLKGLDVASTPKPQTDIYTNTGRFTYPFIYILVPNAGGFSNSANFNLPSTWKASFDLLQQNYNALLQSPYLVGFFTANLLPFIDQGGLFMSDGWFDDVFEKFSFKFDGATGIEIPIINRQQGFIWNGFFVNQMDFQTPFKLQNAYLTTTPPTSSSPFSSSNETKLLTSDYYNIEINGFGMQNKHTFRGEYLCANEFEKIQDPFGMYTNILHNGIVTVIIANSGLYKQYYQPNQVGPDLTPFQIPTVDTTMFPVFTMPTMLPSLADPYLNYMATSQNTMQAGYNVATMNAVVGAASAGIGGLLTGGEAGGLFGLLGASIAGGVAWEKYDMQTKAHIRDLKNSPESVNDLPTDFLTKSSLNSWGAIENQVNDMDAKHFAMKWHLSGYIWERLYLPNNQLLGGRYWFNYLQCDGFTQTFNHEGIPNEVIDFFTEKFKTGMRLWHSRTPDTATEFNNFTKDNTEMYYDRSTWSF